AAHDRGEGRVLIHAVVDAGERLPAGGADARHEVGCTGDGLTAEHEHPSRPGPPYLIADRGDRLRAAVQPPGIALSTEAHRFGPHPRPLSQSFASRVARS